MAINVDIKYKKTPYRYDIYADNKKIKKNRPIDLPDNGQLLLVERNAFLSKAWFILAVFVLLLALFASGYGDWKDYRCNQRFITLSYGRVLSDNLTIMVSNSTGDISVLNVDNYSVIDFKEVHNDKIARRVKIAHGMLIVIPLAILAIIAVLLLVNLFK